MENRMLAGFPGTYYSPILPAKPHPLLFLHGAFADHQGFDTLARLFAARGYAGYAFSRRGRLGQAPENARQLRFRDYLEDTLAVIDAMDTKPILAGHSLGGLLAMKAAEARPDLPALVLIASAPPAMLTAQPIALPHFFPMLPKIFMGKPFIPSQAALKTLALQKLEATEKDRVAASLIRESGIVYREMMLGQVRLEGPFPAVPTLVIGAMEDRIIARGMHRTTARKTNGRLKEYAGHGHWIIAEPGVERVVEDVVEWLER